MSKTIIFLADGMADLPLEELGGKTPLEFVSTPNMDAIAARGASGTFLTLPMGYPTSSDVANMSVLGYSPEKYYPGRGPIEAVSRDIELGPYEVAWRCNLITVEDGILTDFSAGHIDNEVSNELICALEEEFGCGDLSFHPGVSYRNLLVTHGKKFSDKVNYEKPDSSHGEKISGLLLTPGDSSAEAARTAEYLNNLIMESEKFLKAHPLSRSGRSQATHIWPWSPGRKPKFTPFTEKYSGKTGAVICAVDVIKGIAKCAGMSVADVPGATGFIDTNYTGKVEAALEAAKRHDFVYLHVEAIDECSHMGDLKLKMQAISDFDKKVVGPVLKALEGEPVTFAVLPDHPVPIKLRKHTRTPVPVAVCGPHIAPDIISHFSESLAPKGALGFMKDDQLMRLVLNI